MEPKGELRRPSQGRRGSGLRRLWWHWLGPEGPRVEYETTVDTQGFFHTDPDDAGGPFRSFAEAAAAIGFKHHPRGGESGASYEQTEASAPEITPPPPGDRWGPDVYVGLYGERRHLRALLLPPRPKDYYFTLRGGLFYAHPPEVGGPFERLGEAAAAIKCHRTWTSYNPLPAKDYYLTVKDGLFHIHPDGVGGPFSRLDDTTAAIEHHQASQKPPPFDIKQAERESIRRMNIFLSELDIAVYKPFIMSPQTELRKYARKDKGFSEDSVEPDDLEPKKCDPAVLEAVALFDRLVAKKHAIKNGMKWMQNEALQAFEVYLSSTKAKNLKYEFKNLDYQCLIHDSFSKTYHHYNFTMKTRRSSTKRWDYKLFFAEVKATENAKHYFCCPVQPSDNGHCFGCQNVGIDLRHPGSGGYEEGHADSGGYEEGHADSGGFAFDTDSGSDEYDE